VTNVIKDKLYRNRIWLKREKIPPEITRTMTLNGCTYMPREPFKSIIKFSIEKVIITRFRRGDNIYFTGSRS
jgi:hypothetical protein